MFNYDFVSYCSMLRDEPRMDAFEKALRAAVTEDSIVLDLGSGTGFFSILAAQFGAKKVYSVEANALIHLAKEFAAQNGVSEKIEFINKLSTEIEFEEKADVLICDLHGTLPLFESGIASIIDARKRLLKPDAVLIPRKETINFAVAQCGEVFEKNIGRYLRDFRGIDMSSAKHLVTSRLMSINGKKVELLTRPEAFVHLDYGTIEETNFSNNLYFEATQKGVAHGLRGWFECELGNDALITNSNENLETVYGAPFLPFENAVEVDEGDKFEVGLSAVYEKADYTWSWNTKIFDTKGDLKTSFNQSMTAAVFLPPKAVLKQSEFFVPLQNESAKIDSFILSKMDGELLNGDIADELLEKFPDKFKTFEEALERIFELVHRYCD